MTRYEAVMCGITAIFAYPPEAPAVVHGEVKAISNAMFQRGPDGGGFWADNAGRIAMGHRRLAIIDPKPQAAQPMAIDSREGFKERYRIIFNGEIYNFRELKKELEGKGITFSTESDTEVLLRLYERDGANMLEFLRGMYTFVIWDAVGETMFIARDPFGIKPLYLADDGKTLRIASQVKALLAGGQVGHAGPNPAGYVGFLLFGTVPEPHTLYKNIEALPAGQAVTIARGGERKEYRFFSVSERLQRAEYQEAPKLLDLRKLLLDSINHHFVSDVPVGVFLSAGLDSSTICALASETQGSDLRTFTLGFDEFKDTPHDEVPLAEVVSAHYGTRHLTERIEKSYFDSALTNILTAMDQPSIDGVNTYFIARIAASSGLKVVLSGLGGDELFGGYDTFKQVPRLVSLLGAVPGLVPFGRVFRCLAGPLVARMMNAKYAGLFEFGGSYSGAYLLRRGLFMPWELPELIDPEMARTGWENLQPLLSMERQVGQVFSPQNKIRVLETTHYMRNQLLRDADWAGMAHSVEIRVPFVDPVLFETLAPYLGRLDAPTKWCMAATPEKPLPQQVFNRSKTGFNVPIEDWTRMGAVGSENTNVARGGLRPWAVRVLKTASG